jgi:hypothetical protein
MRNIEIPGMTLVYFKDPWLAMNLTVLDLSGSTFDDSMAAAIGKLNNLEVSLYDM